MIILQTCTEDRLWGKLASETAELLKEIILSCSAEDILPEELDNFIDFLANVSDSNANEPQAIDKTGSRGSLSDILLD